MQTQPLLRSFFMKELAKVRNSIEIVPSNENCSCEKKVVLLAHTLRLVYRFLATIFLSKHSESFRNYYNNDAKLLLYRPAIRFACVLQ